MFAVIGDIPELVEKSCDVFSGIGLAFQHLIFGIFEQGKQFFSWCVYNAIHDLNLKVTVHKLQRLFIEITQKREKKLTKIVKKIKSTD